MRELLFEPVRIEDADELFEIIEEAHRSSAFPIGPHWTREQIAEECRSGGRVLRDASHRILAFVLYRDVGEAWEIGFLATRNDAKRHGLMTELLKRIIALRPSGKALWLEVHEANQPARRLYEKLGFQETAKRRGYYSDGGTAILYNYG